MEKREISGTVGGNVNWKLTMKREQPYAPVTYPKKPKTRTQKNICTPL